LADRLLHQPHDFFDGPNVIRNASLHRWRHAERLMRAGEDCFSAEQGVLWFDIDDQAPRYKMVKAINGRREQMIGDGLQMTLDADHWSSINPHEEPIQPDMDFTDEIEWRKNAPDEGKKAS
jgi:hypothetical protein